MNLLITQQEFKFDGAGLKICYGIHETMFGNCLIATTSRGICNLHFLDGVLDGTDDKVAISTLRNDWGEVEISKDLHATQEISDRLFSNPFDSQVSKQIPLTLNFVLNMKRTKFQIEVWQALLKIPFGETRTYQELARSLGRPSSARAIGNAVGKNPISYLIPCHRVIRSSGELGGYRWGVERKAAILNWEADLGCSVSSEPKTIQC
jgi:AraC family transcriptional regulator of adaptative response/methylated-DNA-[protein]-cysteine methyltransferase